MLWVTHCSPWSNLLLPLVPQLTKLTSSFKTLSVPWTTNKLLLTELTRMMRLPAKSFLLIWSRRFNTTRLRLLLPLSFVKIPLKLLKKLKRKFVKLLGILNKTKTVSLLNKLFVSNNTKLGKERMLNMLIKLNPLMKLQRLFNIFKLVLLSLKSRVDLKRSKLNLLKVNTLFSNHWLVLWLNLLLRLTTRLLLRSLISSVKLDNNLFNQETVFKILKIDKLKTGLLKAFIFKKNTRDLLNVNNTLKVLLSHIRILFLQLSRPLKITLLDLKMKLKL